VQVDCLLVAEGLRAVADHEDVVVQRVAQQFELQLFSRFALEEDGFGEQCVEDGLLILQVETGVGHCQKFLYFFEGGLPEDEAGHASAAVAAELVDVVGEDGHPAEGDVEDVLADQGGSVEGEGQLADFAACHSVAMGEHQKGGQQRKGYILSHLINYLPKHIERERGRAEEVLKGEAREVRAADG
jgi:hypothetical protein